MSWRRKVVDGVNSVLNSAGMHILSVSDYHRMRDAFRGQTWESPPVGPAERAYLRADNPRLIELRNKYAGHPAAAHTQWDESNLLQALVPTAFRGENHYVYQAQYSPSPATYMVTARYAQDHDTLGLFGRLKEDGLFGAYTLPYEDGYLISRDLVESINEINFIYRMLDHPPTESCHVLDIGAGYGRLAHRLTEGIPAARATCVDAVPFSTFLSEFYLGFRGVSDRAHVIPLHEAETKLAGETFDLITNIHSFSECQSSVIDWWLSLTTRINVRRMLIIPNVRDTFLSTEPDGTHRDYAPLLTRYGWHLVHKEPIYARSDVAQRYALYPHFAFHWFERRP